MGPTQKRISCQTCTAVSFGFRTRRRHGPWTLQKYKFNTNLQRQQQGTEFPRRYGNRRLNEECLFPKKTPSLSDSCSTVKQPQVPAQSLFGRDHHTMLSQPKKYIGK